MKVFVSGATREMGHYREAVATELRRLGIDPIAQSTFRVDYRDVVELLRQSLKPCDAVICLIGRQYGECPSGQVNREPRSYTQIEFDLAKEMGKRIFTFFPAPACQTAGVGTDTDAQRNLQLKHWDSLYESERLRYEFTDQENLQRLTAEAALTIMHDLAADSRLARMVQDHFPSPLAQLFSEGFRSEQTHKLRVFVYDTLRFLALLALHDAATAGILDRKSPETLTGLQMLTRDVGSREWRSILRLGCSNPQPGDGPRFIPEFAAWDDQHSAILQNLVECEARLTGPPLSDSDFEDSRRELEEALAGIYSNLQFLSRYVLVRVQRNPSPTVRVLRGLYSSSTDLAVVPHSATSLLARELYLCSLDRRTALSLCPVFWVFESSEDVFAWAGLGFTPDPQLKLRSFVRQSLRTVSDAQGSVTADTVATLLAPFLGGSGQLLQAAPEHVGRPPISFEPELWERLDTLAFPATELEVRIDGRFVLFSNPIHRGLHSDLFEAFVSTPGSPGEEPATLPSCPISPLIHVLRKENAGDPDLVSWFQTRQDCWRRIEHPQVLKLYDAVDTEAHSQRPYLITDLIPGRLTLESLLRANNVPGDDLTVQVLVLAAEVCEAAHREGICLVVLPPRHFLIDGDRLWLTGFDTAVDAASVRPALGDYFRRISRDWNDVAPELLTLGTSVRLGRTVDVFALGALCRRLRGGQPVAMKHLSIDAWSDSRECLQFHCLAEDPHLRFQSALHVLMFLRDGASFDALTPPTVPIDGPNEPGSIFMAKFPVTNREYVQFCRDEGHRLPPHLAVRNQDALGRFAGPWLPVTHVNFLDAEAYCRWLSKRTGQRWRLPWVREWVRACGPDVADPTALQSRDYPWGSAEPEDGLANYDFRCGGPTVVGAHRRGVSATGCFDLGGNVWEWCQDYMAGEPKRVLKGGSYQSPSESLTVNAQSGALLTQRDRHTGFRVLCDRP